MGKFQDLIGQKFGRLTVIERVEDYIQPNGTKRTMWLCQCECGNKTTVRRDQLTSGNTQSCGCITKENADDLTGQKFGKLTVLELHHKEQLYRHNGIKDGFKYFWLCQCECGNETIVSSRNLKSWRTQSCGCLQREVSKNLNFKHGLSHSKLFYVWGNIKNRCYNENNCNYCFYGARGIKVCDEWLDKENGFINFYNWAINNGYKEDLSIDRVDVNGDYEPNNCRWATNKEQANNKRNNINIIFNGKTLTLMQWAELYNISHAVLSWRISKGWNIKEALETPIRKRNNLKSN